MEDERSMKIWVKWQLGAIFQSDNCFQLRGVVQSGQERRKSNTGTMGSAVLNRMRRQGIPTSLGLCRALVLTISAAKSCAETLLIDP
jgi:hypothetical protein